MIADSPELGEAGEKQWARLRAQIELAESFWLGFVFSPSPRSVIILRERADRLLRTQTQTLLLVRPSTPDELRSILPMLLESPEPMYAGCTWIEAVREDSPGAPEQPWTRAWDELFLRMNERRDALRARLKGGLVFAAVSAAYEESLALRRRLRELRGDIPEARRDLSLSLLRVCKTRRQCDDLVGADAATAEWLALSLDRAPPPKPRRPRKRARKA